VAGYKVQKPIVCLHTSNELPISNLRKAIPFKIAQKKIRLRMNLAIKVQNLYSETYRKLQKKVRDGNKWKVILCSWMGRFNIGKIVIHFKMMHRIQSNHPLCF
jgi:hypothetical protein